MNENLLHAINILKSGDKEEARNLLIAILRKEPDNEIAWQWMYNAVQNQKEKIDCLKQIIRINPGNTDASRLLLKLQNTPIIKKPVIPLPVAPLQSPKKPNLLLILIAAIVLIVALICCVSLLNVPTELEAKYVVRGSTNSAFINYFNEQGGTEQVEVYLPFEKIMTVSPGAALTIVAQSRGNGSITCEIWLNGKQLKTSTSTAQYGVVTCTDFAH